MKFSEGKVSLPGEKQVYRLQNSDGMLDQDLLTCEDEALAGGEPLLQPVMEHGRRVVPSPSLDEIRDRHRAELEQLDDHYKRLYNPPRYPVITSSKLERLASEVQDQLLDSE